MVIRNSLNKWFDIGFILGLLQSLWIAPVFVLNKFCCFCIYRSHTKQKDDVTDVPLEMAEMLDLQNDDVYLSILMRGQKSSNPPLLVVHGGPGASSLPFRATSAFSTLEKYFCVIYYDQRSTLKSGYKNIQQKGKNSKHFWKTVTIPQHVKDIIFITKYVRRRFNVNRVHLYGGSWGTIIAQLAVRDYPEYFASLTLRGVVVDNVKNEKISTDYIIRRMKRIGLPYYTKEDVLQCQKTFTSHRRKDHTHNKLLQQRTMLASVGGVTHSFENDNYPIEEWKTKALLIKKVILCSEIDLFETAYGLQNGRKTLQTLWSSIQNYISLQHVPLLNVPIILVLQGRHDYCTCSILIDKWFHQLQVKNGKKKLIWFEKSGHTPHIEEKDLFVQEMVKNILGIQYKHC
jgi:proline iminopeptidase